jgi:hypothetical protein
MSSEIEFSLAAVKMLAGVEGIDVLIDGQREATLQFGETMTFEIEAGELTLQTILHGVVNRRSKILTLFAEEGSRIAVVAKYSRFWGNIKLKVVPAS